jgi:NADPH-ferrihemoprotein reductase
MLPLDSLQSLDTFDIVVLVLLLLGGAPFLSKGTYWGKEADVSEATTVDDNDGGNAREVDEDRSIVEKMRSSNKNCVIFFGSQTGSAEDYASRLAKEGTARFSLRTIVADLEDFDYKDLNRFSKDKFAIFVLSSYGDGEPTDNAVDFFEYITSTVEEVSESEDPPPSNLNYVAFGLGNSTYEHYNSVVRKIDSSLGKLGVHRFGPVGEGDDGAGTMEDDLLSWKESMWCAVANNIGLEEGETAYEPVFGVTARDDLTAQSPDVYLGEQNVQHLKGTNGPYNSHSPYIAPVIESREIFQMPDRNCIRMELDISGSGLSYQTGDHVAVWPTNSSTEVDRFLKVHGLIEKRNSVVTVKALEPTAKVPFPTLTTYDSIIRSVVNSITPVNTAVS